MATDWAAPMPMAWAVTEDLKHPDHFPLAPEVVHFAGDGVAVVVAETNEIAHDALDAVVVDYEPLPPVVTMEDALTNSNLVHPELGSNESYTWELKIGEDAVDRAFASAAYTVEERYIQQRLVPMAMEPRAV